MRETLSFNELEDCTFKPSLVSLHHSRVLDGDEVVINAMEEQEYQTIQPVITESIHGFDG
jgi:hypothetical protein